MFEEIAQNSTTVGLLLLIIVMLIREVVVPLVKPDPIRELSKELGKLVEVMSDHNKKITDLHDWMKPEHGRQDWKDTRMISQLSEGVGRFMSNMNDLFMTINGNLENIKDGIEEVKEKQAQMNRL